MIIGDESLAGDQRGPMPDVPQGCRCLLALRGPAAWQPAQGPQTPPPRLPKYQGSKSASSRLKQMEKDHAQKLAKSIQLIAQLQTSVCDCKEEAVRVQQSLERQLEEGQARWDQERRTLSHHADKAHKALQEKAEGLQRQLHSSEKKLLNKELEIQEQCLLLINPQYGDLSRLGSPRVTEPVPQALAALLLSPSPPSPVLGSLAVARTSAPCGSPAPGYYNCDCYYFSQRATAGVHNRLLRTEIQATEGAECVGSR
ncbi:unnamed protein product, partial [Arctogadus glacialis]